MWFRACAGVAVCFFALAQQVAAAWLISVLSSCCASILECVGVYAMLVARWACVNVMLVARSLRVNATLVARCDIFLSWLSTYWRRLRRASVYLGTYLGTLTLLNRRKQWLIN